MTITSSTKKMIERHIDMTMLLVQFFMSDKTDLFRHRTVSSLVTVQRVYLFRVLSSSGSRDFDVQTAHQRQDLSMFMASIFILPAS